MPELPEVETVARDLARHLVNLKIKDLVSVDAKKILKTPLASFRRRVRDKRIERVYRRAKMIVIDLGTQVILFHLKMTGQLIYSAKKVIVAGGHPIISTGVIVPNKYTRVIFKLSRGQLYFNDLRKFGWVKLMKKDDFIRFELTLGIEPLSRDFNLKFFKKMLSRRKRSSIKVALLDQKHLVGLGNIYVDEVLFQAGIQPARKINGLKSKEIEQVFKAIPIILRRAVKKRGTTFRNFVDPDGMSGYFVSDLKVYGRAGKPCKICGRPIKKGRIAARGTHWCEHCQK